MVKCAPVPSDTVHRAVVRERLQNAYRINLLRFWSVTAFFALFLVLGGLLRLPTWTGNLRLFATYWAITALVWWLSRRSMRIAHFSSLTVAVFDAPMVFFLQWATFPTSNPSGVAGFTVGIYVVLVILAALSLRAWYIVFTAAVTTAYEVWLQCLAGVSPGAMAATAILLGLAATACSYSRYRLVALVERVDRDIAEQRRAESALRLAERTAALAALGRELSGTLDPSAVAQRTVDSIAQLLGASTAVLFRRDPASGGFITVARTGVMTRSFPVGTIVAAGAGATGRAAAERRPVTTPDVLADPSIHVPPDLRARILESNHRAACAVPLIVRDAVIGALGVGDVVGRRFTEDEVHLAQSFAHHAALSLENARLYAGLEAHLHQLETTQAQLLHAGKLAAVGQLVTGVAHEINNPLAIIMSQAEMLARRLKDPAHVDRVERIVDSARRAAKIVSGLKTFVRSRPSEVAPLDLREIIVRVLERREEAMRFNGITLIREIPPTVLPILGNAAQLEQVILSLVVNAEQAVTGSPSPRIAVALNRYDSHVRVAVADTGPGIEPEVLPRIFEPFFTTKAPNQNTGLGLSISYSIVQSHGGRLSASSQPGSGATFVVELPAHESEPLTAPAGDLTLPVLRPGQVLVIDDEASVADTLRAMLEDVGLRVSIITDAEDAWLTLTTEGTTFDVVTLDLRLPGLSGRGFYERLETQLPAVAARVLFVTGDITDAETERFLERTGRPVLRKPFALRPLATALAPFLS